MNAPTKTCRRCGLTKPVEEFHRHALSRDGLDHRCKECRREVAKLYYDANRAKVLQESARYYVTHRDEVLNRVNSLNQRKRADAGSTS